MRVHHALVFVFTLLSGIPAAAMAGQARHECSSDTQGTTTYRYCIDTPANPSGEILWYFHPALGNEETWQTYPDNVKIRKNWEDRGLSEPTAISISQGDFWLMTLENKMYPDFVESILPALEAKAGGLHGRRILLGYSMGGFNAAQLLLRDGALFDRVALLSPAFLTIGPYSTKDEINAYFTRNNLGYSGQFKVNAFLDLLKQNFSSPESWTAHNPLELVKSGLPAGTRLYVSAGDQDNYGFHEGASVFVEAAPTRGADVTWDSLHGGHQTMNPTAIGLFLVP